MTAPAAGPKLNTMVLAELRAIASGLGLTGISGMRKGELIEAIEGKRRGAVAGKPKSRPADQEPAAQEPAAQQASAAPVQAADRAERNGAGHAIANGAAAAENNPADNSRDENNRDDNNAEQSDERRSSRSSRRRRSGARRSDQEHDNAAPDEAEKGSRERENGHSASDASVAQSSARAAYAEADDDEEGGRGRRGRRFRDRRRGRGERGENDAVAAPREDDVLQPVAGILDLMDNYAFLRTSGYVPGQGDVYVSMNMIRKYGLRRGDAIVGAVKAPKDSGQSGDGGNNQRQKFNPLVRIDSVSGIEPERALRRPDFTKLTPLYPNQRLRLETTPDKLSTRVIDLIMPIGKGQRALIVAPPKAGKTTILQDIANAIAQNNPECYLMVVLVDERPEEVTDMQRSVRGEVIASTFDRPPSDHTMVAELAIERAKRLVELGRDVVVLLDSITRLGRAYNNASPASGRILSGGVDATALYPPKRFLGAARNIENGGSLTIIASALVETGSTGDTVIYEEFKGTGNAELKLDRKVAERRVFPAVDVNPSNTRKDELLLGSDEFQVVHKLRRLLSGLDTHQAIDLLISQLRKTKSNVEFLVQVSKTAPGQLDQDN
nr:transcription termination factor Rho [Segniliparus rotundus]